MTDIDEQWKAACNKLLKRQPYPICYVYPEEVRDAAQIMRNEIGRLNAELQSLRSAQQWRGIESAPTDDTFLVRKDNRVAIAFRDTGMSSYRFFCPIRQADLPFSPDEWCPLPAAPLPATGADQ